MPRAKKPTHQPFEGRDPRGAFCKITADMMNSKAWALLTLQQRGLYLHFKAKYRQKVVAGHFVSSNQDDLCFPVSEWSPLYHGNYRSFKADMQALIDLGFIRVVADRHHIRLATIYGLDDGWQRDPPD